jgi:transposase
MSEEDYAGLITAAHHELKAPVILIWDRLNTHVSAVMRAFIHSHQGWLTEVRLPAYAPELNPAGGARAAMKNGLGNLAVRDVDQLAAIMKNRLKSIQYRPALIEAFPAQAGLTLDPQPP